MFPFKNYPAGRLTFLMGLLLAALSLSPAARANHLKPPTGKIILTVSGAIEHRNGEGGARFDREMLEALGMHSLTVVTPWTDGANRFTGPLVRDLLAEVGARGTSLTATAINDYQTEIPIADSQTYPIIFAMEMNGQRLGIRDRGPLWVIYPWLDDKTLQTENYFSRSIWQLKSFVVND
tara:strand:- start:5183 stop:5719 length:537 start_codon:yes stop_codon:yes gene_type:complete